MMRTLSVVLILLLFISCNRGKKSKSLSDSRTSGKTTILVDESFSRVLNDQIEVFTSDYPDAKVTTIAGNEAKILPELLSGKKRMIILSRLLKPSEEYYYKQKQIAIFSDRFAIDGIALITNSQNTDTLITAKEVFDILRGVNTGKKLVFDNANSSTVRYFMDSAKVTTLPKSGVYTLNTNQDVIKYVAEHKDYIGVLGINWLIRNEGDSLADVAKVKIMAVKGLKGKNFYTPTQNNLINGVYPFLRNIYIINCEGTNSLGTGFANWLNSPRGQLIVLKSGLGPHKMISRDINIR
ncbi:substrate-binding domain-containing protein [Pedobacter sp. Du54]|uniref:substrate-binding domain-containing protein n=1 Tax=Pedobacter anseongensis TaxID=3133439 RepID=UPI0030A431A3